MNHAEFATRCTAIELMVDSLGDAAYQLADGDDWDETHLAICHVCDGLHALDGIVKKTAPSPAARVVAAAPETSPRSEPNRTESPEGDAAAATTCSTPATARANAPGMDRESTSRKERHDPLHALAVQNHEGDRA